MGKSPYSDHVFVQTSSDMEDVHGILNGDRTSNLGAPTLSLSLSIAHRIIHSQGLFYRVIVMFHIDYHFLQIKTYLRHCQ